VPKTTFHNLPRKKRDRIVELAIAEFATRPYHTASLTRIVTQAGIAKGSIYQYFDNKLDLYRWLLLQELPRRKVEAMQRDADAEHPATLRAMLRTAVTAGLRFMLANPRLAQLGAAVTMPTADPELRALYREIRTAGETAFREMLAAAVERGELRDDVDLDVVTRILSTVLTDGIRAIAIHRLGVDFMDLCSGEAAALPDDDLALIVDDTLTVLLHGIASR
jgi:AcrR family transcriptional regulator